MALFKKRSQKKKSTTRATKTTTTKKTSRTEEVCKTDKDSDYKKELEAAKKRHNETLGKLFKQTVAPRKQETKGGNKSTLRCPFGTKGQSEKTVRTHCKKWLKSQGIHSVTIYSGGVFSSAMSGIPDQLCFDRKNKKLVWIELKRNEGGKLSTEQIDFHKWLTYCGQTVIIACSLKHLQDEWSKVC